MVERELVHRLAAVEAGLEEFAERVEEQLAYLKLDNCKVLDMIASKGRQSMVITTEPNELSMEKLKRDMDHMKHELDESVASLRNVDKSISSRPRSESEDFEIRKQIADMQALVKTFTNLGETVDSLQDENAEIRKHVEGMDAQLQKAEETVSKIQDELDKAVQVQKISTISSLKFAISMMPRSLSQQEKVIKQLSQKEDELKNASFNRQYSPLTDPMLQDINGAFDKPSNNDVVQSSTPVPRGDENHKAPHDPV